MNTTVTDPPRKLYTVALIHKAFDWDAQLQFRAPTARIARASARQKMATPGNWLVVSAKQVKA